MNKPKTSPTKFLTFYEDYFFSILFFAFIAGFILVLCLPPQKSEFVNGILVGIIAVLSIAFLISIPIAQENKFSKLALQQQKRFDDALNYAQQRVNNLAKATQQYSEALKKDKEILSSESEKIILQLKKLSETANQEIKSLIKENQEAFSAFTQEIDTKTKQSFQEITDQMEKIKEAMEIFVAIAQKKKDNEEKRKYHGKAKREQNLKATKQELKQRGKTILGTDNKKNQE